MNTAVLYARFSPRPNAADSESCETQLERMRSYCAASGWTILSEHRDDGLSGSQAANRPGLQAALAAACRPATVLVVYSLSRLARNTSDAIGLAARLDAAGADLASLHEKIDTTSAMGRFLFRLMASLAELEREQIAERTSDAMRRHQSSGRRMGCTSAPNLWAGKEVVCTPFGQQPDPENPERMIDDPHEQAALRYMRHCRRQGRTYREIARLLEQAGYACRGTAWHHQTVSRLLARSS
jgi:DNA invertase Pin-like site-specific DNA recombinase